MRGMSHGQKSGRLKQLGVMPVVGLLLLLLAWTGCGGSPPLRLAADESNDLVGVLRDSGIPFVLHDSIRQAVEQADPGAGVLALADNYPAETIEVTRETMDLAGRKNLRVFLEYPGRVGSMEFASPFQDRLLRAVVSSGFFGTELPRSRILAVNGMHLVPFSECGEIHLRAARVAGFDRAVFGLPENSFPLLAEIPLEVSGNDLSIP